MPVLLWEWVQWAKAWADSGFPKRCGTPHPYGWRREPLCWQGSRVGIRHLRGDTHFATTVSVSDWPGCRWNPRAASALILPGLQWAAAWGAGLSWWPRQQHIGSSLKSASCLFVSSSPVSPAGWEKAQEGGTCTLPPMIPTELGTPYSCPLQSQAGVGKEGIWGCSSACISQGQWQWQDTVFSFQRLLPASRDNTGGAAGAERGNRPTAAAVPRQT